MPSLSGGARHAIQCHHCKKEVRETGNPSRYCPFCEGELREAYWNPMSYEEYLKANNLKPVPESE